MSNPSDNFQPEDSGDERVDLGDTRDSNFGSPNSTASSRKQAAAPSFNALLNSDAIDHRFGNYIFTFGKRSSGKTTLQFHLLRWLMTGGDFNTEALPIENSMAAHAIVDQWQQMWADGRFPLSTETQQPKEFKFKVSPHEGITDPLTFSFFEIAGEDFQSVRVTEDNPDPQMLDVLDRFLRNPNINFSLVLVCDGDDPEEDDIFISAFLTFLHKEYGYRFHDTAPIMLVIAKSDLGIKKLRADNETGQDSTIKLNNAVFLNRYLKRTANALRAWPAGHQIFSFKVGIVEGQGSSSRIVKAEFQDIGKIFASLYRRFIGKNLGPTRWQKMKAKFDELIPD